MGRMEFYLAPYIVYFLRTVFNGILIGILIGFSIYLVDKAQAKEASSQRQIYVSYAGFCLTYGLTRFFFVFSDFIVYHSPSYRITNSDPLNDLFIGLAYVIVIAGFLLLQIMVERHLLHTRFVFTILCSVIFVLAVLSAIQIIPTDIPRFIVMIAFPGLVFIVGGLYVYVAIKSTGDVRKRAIGIIIGLLTIGVGILLESSLLGDILDLIPNMFALRILISPFIIMVGAAIFSISQR